MFSSIEGRLERVMFSTISRPSLNALYHLQARVFDKTDLP